MSKEFESYSGQLNRNNMLSHTLRQVIFCLSFVVIMAVFWSLKLTGIGIAGEAFCGFDEHEHTEECSPRTLICELQEEEPHIHAESCLQRLLICEKEEQEAHTHDDTCLGSVLVCETPEQAAHTHDEACGGLKLICEIEESAGHTHTDSCIHAELICEQEEVKGHTHAGDCILTELICEKEEFAGHIHDKTCDETVLACGKETVPGHSHGSGCYSLSDYVVCGEEESESHTHDDSCREKLLVCETPESEGHTHVDSCLKTTRICQLEEIAGHTHGDSCYKKTVVCEEEEIEGHTHVDSCYEKTIECELEEVPGHTHDSGCYEKTSDCALIEMAEHFHGEECYILSAEAPCEKIESEGHIHEDACWQIIGKFGCGLTEAEGHIHDETCICEETLLECGEEARTGHTHGDECYVVEVPCEKQEHIHVESCYSNLTADLETAQDWEESLKDVLFSLKTSENVIAVARSQLGVRESEVNFVVDGRYVRRGITRYGQWYGNPYADWSAMFVSFCLYYAGEENLPANAGPESMRLEWEQEGMYKAAGDYVPQVGNLLFLSKPKQEEFFRITRETDEAELEMVLEEVTGAVYDTAALGSAAGAFVSKPTATAVAIITEVTENTIHVIEGDLDNAVGETTYDIDDAYIMGYGLVPDSAGYIPLMAAPATAQPVARTTDYRNNLLTGAYQFIFYTIVGENAYAIDGGGNAVPVYVGDDGLIRTDAADPTMLLWTCQRNGNSGNNYFIQNVGSTRYLHPFYNSGTDNGIVPPGRWNTTATASGTGVRFSHSAYVGFDSANSRFVMTRESGQNVTFRVGITETCTVWLDGSDGGLSGFGGSPNEKYSVATYTQMTLPTQWVSPTKYDYRLRGWYDVTNNRYYAPGEKVTITGNTVFYADWMASTYNIGQYNAYVADTVSTNNFITTRLFDYNYLFNVLSADPKVTVSNSSHSEDWSIVQNESVEYEDRNSLNFIFLDYGDGGTLDYPNNRQDGVNAFPGDGIVTGGIYNGNIREALFSTDDNIPGKVYLGTADHLFQIMDDPNDPHYGYYYYDSAKNAASYNQSARRFYIYDYLEATRAELAATKSDFLPLNSPYANTNGQIVATYNADGEHANMTNYVYDAEYQDSENSTDRVSTNYAFGMKMDIRFYLPNKPGEGGNQDLYGNDMHFEFSGDDDLWVLVDGKLALDIGGIHRAEHGEINFSTGDVNVQGVRNNALSQVVSSLEPGEHTLTVMYLERGASHSNCAIYFNLAPRFRLDIQKEDVLSRDVLNGAQFSVYQDLECTIPAMLWTSEASYNQGDPATNVFTVTNGVAKMWGMGAGNTYYFKETRPPDNKDYGFPNGIIRMVLDKKGSATYSVMILDGGDGISGGFTVHGFRVDEETQQAYIIATNAPKWVKEVTSVEARKFWDDGKDHSGDAVTVYLTVTDPDGTVRRLQEVQLSEEIDWHHVWDNLPKQYEDGTPIQYGVEEAYVSGYYSEVEKVTTFSVSSSRWETTTTLENGKTYLLKTNSGFLSTQNRNSDTGYMWVNEATAQQSDLAQWVITKNGKNYRLTNKAGQSITFYYANGSPTDFYASTGGENDASKQYFAAAVSGSQIRFYYDAPNNRDYYLVSSMTGSQKFNYSTTSRDGLLFTPMTLKQTNVTIPAEGEVAYQITNTLLSSETALTVHKQWRLNVGDDPSIYEQFQVTVKLLANGKDTGRTVTLTLKNSWTDTFRGLPYQDSDGNVISYSVEEIWNKDRWSTSYGPIQTLGGSPPTYSTTITNSYYAGVPELPSTGSAARMIYILCGAGIMLGSLVYGFVSRRKRERRTK